MSTPDFPGLEKIAADLGAGPVEFPGPASSVPAGWETILDSPEPAARRAAAVGLWNQDLIDALPRFARSLRNELTDVRVCRVRGDWAICYLLRGRSGGQVGWIGWDPATLGDLPSRIWPSIPQPLREFLTGVHAGFTAPDGESYGVVRPAEMVSYAAWGGFDGPIPDWDEHGALSSTELTFLTRDSGLLHYCVSAALPPGAFALAYEGDVQVEDDLLDALDRLMTERFETE